MFGGCGCDTTDFINTVSRNNECLPNVVTLTITGAANMNMKHPLKLNQIFGLYNVTLGHYITSDSYIVEMNADQGFPREGIAWPTAFIPQNTNYPGGDDLLGDCILGNQNADGGGLSGPCILDIADYLSVTYDVNNAGPM